MPSVVKQKFRALPVGCKKPPHGRFPRRKFREAFCGRDEEKKIFGNFSPL